MVPEPDPVKTSTSSASWARPSTMWVRATPPVAARMQASTLGRMPPAMAPESSSGRSSSGEAKGSTVLGSRRLRMTPGAPVRKISFSALRARATLSATVSALTLRAWPSSSPARLARTGTKCPSSRASSRDGSTFWMSPTKPKSTTWRWPSSSWTSSGARRVACSVPASTPLRPTACRPWRTRAPTSSRLREPPQTILTASSDCASVTRRPATRRGSKPRRRDRALTCGPPPCTTTRRMPIELRSAIWPASPSRASPSASTSPPSFSTKVEPR